MTLIATPEIGRRRFVTAALAGATVLALPSWARAQQSLLATPAQGEGPFYPTAFPPDVDNDLVVVKGSAAQAVGTVTHIRGRVLDTAGRPLAGARVEIWQCDARGIYLHPGSSSGKQRDMAFQGFGRTEAAADGSYSFRTIRPVVYPGRTPHIHFAVVAPSKKLITQMYVAGEPRNASDGGWNGIRDKRQQDAITVKLEPANGIEAGALAGQFDLVLKA
jgi:protocatechuate 3,4-dioxygenase beta subunit